MLQTLLTNHFKQDIVPRDISCPLLSLGELGNCDIIVSCCNNNKTIQSRVNPGKYVRRIVPGNQCNWLWSHEIKIHQLIHVQTNVFLSDDACVCACGWLSEVSSMTLKSPDHLQRALTVHSESSCVSSGHFADQVTHKWKRVQWERNKCNWSETQVPVECARWNAGKCPPSVLRMPAEGGLLT